MSNSIAQSTPDVKLIELVARANTLILALADVDEGSPLGRAVGDWLRDAEDAIGPNGDCKCVLPGQSCPTCEMTSAIYFGDEEPALDGGWYGYALEEVMS